MIRRLREEFAKPWARTTTTSVFILSVLTNVLTLTGVWDRFIAPAIWPPRADVNMVCKAISYMTDDELLSQPSRVDQMVMLGDSGALVRPASAYSGNSLVFLNMFQGVAPFANFNNDRTPVYPAANPFMQCTVTNASDNGKEAHHVVVTLDPYWGSGAGAIHYATSTAPVNLVEHDSFTFDVVNHSSQLLAVTVDTKGGADYNFEPQQCRFVLDSAWPSEWWTRRHPYKYNPKVPPPLPRDYPQVFNCP